MGFRWSEVQILSPRPTSLSVDRIPGPVSSLPPGVRRVKYPPDILLCRLTLSPRPTCGVSHPASLASPGQTFRGLPVRPGGDSLDHRQYSVSPLSGDRIPGPVSSLPPGVRRIKLSHCAFLLHSKVRGRPSVVCPFDRAVIHWITANTPSHPLDILLFPPHPLAPINIAGNTQRWPKFHVHPNRNRFRTTTRGSALQE